MSPNATSTRFLNPSGDGDSIPALGSLFQCSSSKDIFPNIPPQPCEETACGVAALPAQSLQQMLGKPTREICYFCRPGTFAWHSAAAQRWVSGAGCFGSHVSVPQVSPPHRRAAGHHDAVWPLPQPSTHLPCCTDEASSISSPATLCEEEQHGLLLGAGGLCCACLLLWLPPEPRSGPGEQGAARQLCGTTGRDGGVLQAMVVGAGSPARPSFQPCPRKLGEGQV